MLVFTVFLLCILGGMSHSLLRASILVINPSFEDISGESLNNEFTFGPLTGWDLYEATPGQTSGGDGPNYFIGTLGPRTSGTQGGIDAFFDIGQWEGSRTGIAFNFNASGGGGEYGFVQQLSSTLQPNTLYTLEVDVGNIGSGTSQNGTNWNLDGFSGYRIDLLAGNEVLASDNNSLTIAERTFETSQVIFQANGTHDHLLNQALSIRLVNLNIIDATHTTADLEVDFDNVRLNAVVIPEPSGAALLITGMCLSLTFTRRRN